MCQFLFLQRRIDEYGFGDGVDGRKYHGVKVVERTYQTKYKLRYRVFKYVIAESLHLPMRYNRFYV